MFHDMFVYGSGLRWEPRHYKNVPRETLWTMKKKSSVAPRVKSGFFSFPRLLRPTGKIIIITSEMSDLLANPKYCQNCSAPGSEFKCPCKIGYYCSKDCQKKHWKTHKISCAYALDQDLKGAKKEHGKNAWQVAIARCESGKVWAKQGRFAEAERNFLDALRIIRKEFGAGGSAGDRNLFLAKASRGLGATYTKMCRFDEAAKALQESLACIRGELGERSGEAGDVLNDIGEVLLQHGKFRESLSTLEEAKQIHTEVGGATCAGVSLALTRIGCCYRRMGGHQDKEFAAFKQALAIIRDTHGNDSEEIAMALFNLGSVTHDVTQAGMQNFAQARAYLEEALGIYRRVRGERHPSVGDALNNIGNLLREQHQYDDALEMHNKALKIRRRALGDDHAMVANSHHNIGRIFYDQGNHDAAQDHFKQSLAIYDRSLGENCPESKSIRVEMMRSSVRRSCAQQ
jgi:tetratricopeptide (TPR) repeat protein